MFLKKQENDEINIIKGENPACRQVDASCPLKLTGGESNVYRYDAIQ